MIIDFNAHYGAGPGGVAWRSAEQLSRLENDAGVELTVASDLASAFGGASAAQDRLPSNLVAFAGLGPSFDPQSVPPVKGVRIYPTYQEWDFDGDGASKLMSLVRGNGLILQVYLRLQDPRAMPPAVAIGSVIKQVQQLIEANEDVRFVISGASLAEVTASPALFGRPNVWADISHVQHPIHSLPKLLDAIDSSQVLFGSGAPVLYPYANIYRVINSPIPESIKEAILRRNARELLS